MNTYEIIILIGMVLGAVYAIWSNKKGIDHTLI